MCFLGSLVRLGVWATQVWAKLEPYPFGEQKGVRLILKASLNASY